MNLLRTFSLAALSLLAVSTSHALAPAWPQEGSDLKTDPTTVYGRLDNGMRYVIRRNGTPAGTALVRMEVAAGSLDESDAERGF
ncbi:MAG: hypothetical protein KDK97_23575, partial [Verrucomicrobiales bacterium]|nr:hypothetical protein [Verrucomicrobiales bacterium]